MDGWQDSEGACAYDEDEDEFTTPGLASDEGQAEGEAELIEETEELQQEEETAGEETVEQEELAEAEAEEAVEEQEGGEQAEEDADAAVAEEEAGEAEAEAEAEATEEEAQPQEKVLEAEEELAQEEEDAQEEQKAQGEGEEKKEAAVEMEDGAGAAAEEAAAAEAGVQSDDAGPVLASSEAVPSDPNSPAGRSDRPRRIDASTPLVWRREKATPDGAMVGPSASSRGPSPPVKSGIEHSKALSPFPRSDPSSYTGPLVGPFPPTIQVGCPPPQPTPKFEFPDEAWRQVDWYREVRRPESSMSSRSSPLTARTLRPAGKIAAPWIAATRGGHAGWCSAPTSPSTGLPTLKRGAAEDIRPNTAPTGNQTQGSGLPALSRDREEGSTRPATADGVSDRSRSTSRDPPESKAAKNAKENLPYSPILAEALAKLERPNSVWDAHLWLQARNEVANDGRLRTFQRLMQCVANSSARALTRGAFDVHDSRTGGRRVVRFSNVKELNRPGLVNWFGRSNVHIPTIEDSVALPPPLIISEQGPLDLVVSMRRAGLCEHFPPVLVVELVEFTKDGSAELRRQSAMHPHCLPVRTDFQRFVHGAGIHLQKKVENNGQNCATVRDHLAAQQDPYIFLCPRLTIFRGSQDDGYPFLEEPVEAHVLATAMPNTRPAVQIVEGPNGYTSWYVSKADHTALIERLNLIGLTALQAAATHVPAEDEAKGGEERKEDHLPTLILTTLGFGGRDSRGPRDAFASSLKQWRQRFATKFRTVYVACGGRGGRDPNLAAHLDQVVNRNIYRLIESDHPRKAKVSPWHWDARELALSISSSRLFAANRRFKQSTVRRLTGPANMAHDHATQEGRKKEAKDKVIVAAINKVASSPRQTEHQVVYVGQKKASRAGSFVQFSQEGLVQQGDVPIDDSEVDEDRSDAEEGGDILGEDLVRSETQNTGSATSELDSLDDLPPPADQYGIQAPGIILVRRPSDAADDKRVSTGKNIVDQMIEDQQHYAGSRRASGSKSPGPGLGLSSGQQSPAPNLESPKGLGPNLNRGFIHRLSTRMTQQGLALGTQVAALKRAADVAAMQRSARKSLRAQIQDASGLEGSKSPGKQSPGSSRRSSRRGSDASTRGNGSRRNSKRRKSRSSQISESSRRQSEMQAAGNLLTIPGAPDSAPSGSDQSTTEGENSDSSTRKRSKRSPSKSRGKGESPKATAAGENVSAAEMPSETVATTAATDEIQAAGHQQCQDGETAAQSVLVERRTWPLEKRRPPRSLSGPERDPRAESSKASPGTRRSKSSELDDRGALRSYTGDPGREALFKAKVLELKAMATQRSEQRKFKTQAESPGQPSVQRGDEQATVSAEAGPDSRSQPTASRTRAQSDDVLLEGRSGEAKEELLVPKRKSERLKTQPAPTTTSSLLLEPSTKPPKAQVEGTSTGTDSAASAEPAPAQESTSQPKKKEADTSSPSRSKSSRASKESMSSEDVDQFGHERQVFVEEKSPTTQQTSPSQSIRSDEESKRDEAKSNYEKVRGSTKTSALRSSKASIRESDEPARRLTLQAPAGTEERRNSSSSAKGPRQHASILEQPVKVIGEENQTGKPAGSAREEVARKASERLKRGSMEVESYAAQVEAQLSMRRVGSNAGAPRTVSKSFGGGRDSGGENDDIFNEVANFRTLSERAQHTHRTSASSTSASSAAPVESRKSQGAITHRASRASVLDSVHEDLIVADMEKNGLFNKTYSSHWDHGSNAKGKVRGSMIDVMHERIGGRASIKHGLEEEDEEELDPYSGKRGFSGAEQIQTGRRVSNMPSLGKRNFAF